MLTTAFTGREQPQGLRPEPLRSPSALRSAAFPPPRGNLRHAGPGPAAAEGPRQPGLTLAATPASSPGFRGSGAAPRKQASASPPVARRRAPAPLQGRPRPAPAPRKGGFRARGALRRQHLAALPAAAALPTNFVGSRLACATRRGLGRGGPEGFWAGVGPRTGRRDGSAGTARRPTPLEPEAPSLCHNRCPYPRWRPCRFLRHPRFRRPPCFNQRPTTV